MILLEEGLRMLISRFFMSLGLTSWKCQTLSVKEDKLPQEFIARCWAAHGLFRKARASGFESGREGRKTVLLEAPPKPPWGSYPARIALLLLPESLPVLALSLDIGYDTRHGVGSPVLEAPGNWLLLVRKEPCSLPASQYDSHRCLRLEYLRVQGVGMRYHASQEGEVHPLSAGWAETVP